MNNSKESHLPMTDIQLSDLAYNIFLKGQYYQELCDYCDKKDITCPEDLFFELRKYLIMSYNEAIKSIKDKDLINPKKDIGEYHFRKNKLPLVGLFKTLEYYLRYSSFSDKVVKGKFYKILCEYRKDVAVRIVTESEEYRDFLFN